MSLDSIPLVVPMLKQPEQAGVTLAILHFNCCVFALASEDPFKPA